MVRPSEIPPREPQWNARPLLASEILKLTFNEDVPGVNLDDPRVKAIKGLIVGTMGRLAFTQAKQDGYRYFPAQTGNCRDVSTDTLYLWSWWCAASKQPDVVLHASSADDCRVTCDVSSAGKIFSAAIFRLLGQRAADSLSTNFLLTQDTFQMDGLDSEMAISLARSMVQIGKDDRFLRDER